MRSCSSPLETFIRLKCEVLSCSFAAKATHPTPFTFSSPPALISSFPTIACPKTCLFVSYKPSLHIRFNFGPIRTHFVFSVGHFFHHSFLPSSLYFEIARVSCISSRQVSIYKSPSRPHHHTPSDILPILSYGFVCLNVRRCHVCELGLRQD